MEWWHIVLTILGSSALGIFITELSHRKERKASTKDIEVKSYLDLENYYKGVAEDLKRRMKLEEGTNRKMQQQYEKMLKHTEDCEKDLKLFKEKLDNLTNKEQ